MKTLPLLLLMGASVALGLLMARRFWRREKNRPVHIALHLLLGIAGLEAMAMLKRGAPDGSVMAAGTWGDAALLALAISVITGFVLTVVGPQGARAPGVAALGAHAAAGAAGFGLFLAWLAAA